MLSGGRGYRLLSRHSRIQVAPEIQQPKSPSHARDRWRTFLRRCTEHWNTRANEYWERWAWPTSGPSWSCQRRTKCHANKALRVEARTKGKARLDWAHVQGIHAKQGSARRHTALADQYQKRERFVAGPGRQRLDYHPSDTTDDYTTTHV